MNRISYSTPDELKLEVVLDATGTEVRQDDASALHLLFTECVRGKELPDAYERFRQELCSRWNYSVNASTAYLVVEQVVALTSRLKKTHISALGSTSSESTPLADPSTK